MLVSDPKTRYHSKVASILRQSIKAKQDAKKRVARSNPNQVNQTRTTMDSRKRQLSLAMKKNRWKEHPKE